jgi:hypothetical protein
LQDTVENALAEYLLENEIEDEGEIDEGEIKELKLNIEDDEVVVV